LATHQLAVYPINLEDRAGSLPWMESTRCFCISTAAARSFWHIGAAWQILRRMARFGNACVTQFVEIKTVQMEPYAMDSSCAS
jgi:hypothetical protein